MGHICARSKHGMWGSWSSMELESKHNGYIMVYPYENGWMTIPDPTFDQQTR
jgi:hypothetical protein